jgi:acyl-CoA thioester hydrolase
MKNFNLNFEVRDYECDLQGIVNNAVYQNYLEHARHKYLKAIGLDFAQMHLDGIDPIVYRIEIDYKKPLKSGDTFTIQLMVERDGNLKFIFNQQIFKNDGVLILKAKVIAVFTKNGRPIVPPQKVIEALLS